MIQAINEQEFDQAVLKQPGLVVVDFNADWCGPCQMLKPVLEQLSTENQVVKFVAVNVDESGSLAREYGVMSIPCVVVMKDGQEVDRSVGFVPKSKLQDMLKGLQA